ncbi:MAG: hydrogenase formation protein HypD [Myxococcota bacterium]
MEVCGTHTMAIYQFGLRELLPPNLDMLSGPGCPVCVTPNDYLDKAIWLSSRRDVIIATFGDMMRVPGSRSSLERERAAGADVRVLYSPADALKIAEENPEKSVIFLSVGFETTAPLPAMTLISARKRGLKNFMLLTANKTVPEPLKALAKGRVKLDGFLCPGHVSVIIGSAVYEEIARDGGIPCVIAGFEPVDIMHGLLKLSEFFVGGEKGVFNTYRRAVASDGNIEARRAMETVFEPCDAEWRGIGVIPDSGLKIRAEFAEFDAENRFDIDIPRAVEPSGCRCGEVLTGAIRPPECPLFGTVCVPESPVGACMVSSEGSCAASYKYGMR